MHLLGGQPSEGEVQPSTMAPTEGQSFDRVARLEEEVRALRGEVEALWKELRSLTMQPE